VALGNIGEKSALSALKRPPVMAGPLIAEHARWGDGTDSSRAVTGNLPTRFQRQGAAAPMPQTKNNSIRKPGNPEFFPWFLVSGLPHKKIFAAG